MFEFPRVSCVFLPFSIPGGVALFFLRLSLAFFWALLVWLGLNSCLLPSDSVCLCCTVLHRFLQIWPWPCLPQKGLLILNKYCWTTLPLTWVHLSHFCCSYFCCMRITKGTSVLLQILSPSTPYRGIALSIFSASSLMLKNISAGKLVDLYNHFECFVRSNFVLSPIFHYNLSLLLWLFNVWGENATYGSSSAKWREVRTESCTLFYGNMWVFVSISLLSCKLISAVCCSRGWKCDIYLKQNSDTYNKWKASADFPLFILTSCVLSYFAF